KDNFKKLSIIYHDQNKQDIYKTTLSQKLTSFHDVGKGSIVAVPWMRYHVKEVKMILNSYLSGHKMLNGKNDEPILSAPGARKLSAVTDILMQCRTNFSGSEHTHVELDSKRSSTSNNSKNREPVSME